MGLEILHQGHDLGHAGLVVRPQEGGAVGDDQVLPQVLVQTLVYVGAHGHAQSLVEDDGPAVVVLHDPGPDPRAAGLGGGVHMGDQAQGHPLPTLREVGREGPHDVAVPVHTGVLHTQGPELLRQEPGPGSHWHSVLGICSRPAADWVLTATYRRKRSSTRILILSL